MAANTIVLQKLKEFFKVNEGFSPYPIWDFKQWSWGYGTAAGYDKTKKPAGAITKEQAWQDAAKLVNQLHDQLAPLLTTSLNPGQMAAWLSFAYNTGPGNAKKLLPNINSGNTAALEKQWKKYIIAGGKINKGLVNRRNHEWDMWIGKGGGAGINPMFLLLSLLFH